MDELRSRVNENARLNNVRRQLRNDGRGGFDTDTTGALLTKNEAKQIGACLGSGVGIG